MLRLTILFRLARKKKKKKKKGNAKTVNKGTHRGLKNGLELSAVRQSATMK